MIDGDLALYHGRRLAQRLGPVLDVGLDHAAAGRLAGLCGLVRGRDHPAGAQLSAEAYGLLMDLEQVEPEVLGDPSAEGEPTPAAGVRRAVELLEQQLHRPALTVDDLADAAGYSRFHFSRLYRQHTGLSPYQHLLQARIGAAQRMLATTHEPIKRVAYACGFSSASWFSAAFRRHVGQSPAQWRAQQRRQPADEVVSSR
jgi:transcriptional regulator GlxA family with amidase domain